MKILPSLLVAAALVFSVLPVAAQVPGLLNYQGKIAVGAAPFTGTGYLKFALVNGDGSVTYWSNDGTSANGSEPATALSRAVEKGVYSLLLGDTTVPNMTAEVPASIFANPDVRLRVWFDDGTNGSELLAPDQRLVAVGYAMVAEVAQTVADGSITAEKLAPGLTLGGGGAGTFDSITLSTSNGPTAGVLTQDGVPILHTYGGANFFGGAASGNFTMSGGGNAAVGAYSFRKNTSGDQNATFGFGSLSDNTTGGGNTAIGFSALSANTEGSQNSAFGYAAMQGNKTGAYNVALGPYTLIQSKEGTGNVALGYAAGYNLRTGDDNIYIGNQGQREESGTIRIGGGSHTDTYVAGVLHGDGSGLTNLPKSGGAGTTWSSTDGTTQTATANSGYIAANAAQTQYILPTDATIGATVRIVGAGAGGFKVVAGAGQTLGTGTLPSGFDGIEWTAVNLNLQSPFYPDDPGAPILSSFDGTQFLLLSSGGALYSHDAGANWTAGTAIPGVAADFSGPTPIFINPQLDMSAATGDLSHVYLPLVKTVFDENFLPSFSTTLVESTDGGATFAPASIVLPGDLATKGSLLAPIRVTADGTGLWVFAYFGFDPLTNARDNRLYSSLDAGASWTLCSLPPQASGFDAGTFLGSRTNPGGLVLSGSDQDGNYAYFATADSGTTWTTISLPYSDGFMQDGPLLGNSDLTRLVVLRGESDPLTGDPISSVLTSADSGATWTTHRISADSAQYDFLRAVSDDLQVMALSNPLDSSVTATVDGGAHWSHVPLSASIDFVQPSALTITPTGGRLLYADFDGGQIYSTTLNASGSYAIIGAQWASVEFIYLGNGQWAPITVTGSARAQ